MKNTKVRIHRLLVLLLLFANFASRASAANKGFVIAMGGGNGTPEIYEKWRTLGGGTNAPLCSFQQPIILAMTSLQFLKG